MKILFTILVLFSAASYAKCPTDIYVFSGKITSQKGVAIESAKVSVSFKKRDGQQSILTTKIGKKGDFKFEIQFHSYAGMKSDGLHICNLKLTTATIQIDAPGYIKESEKINVRSKQTTYNKQIKPISKNGMVY